MCAFCACNICVTGTTTATGSLTGCTGAATVTGRSRTPYGFVSGDFPLGVRREGMRQLLSFADAIRSITGHSIVQTTSQTVIDRMNRDSFKCGATWPSDSIVFDRCFLSCAHTHTQFPSGVSKISEKYNATNCNIERSANERGMNLWHEMDIFTWPHNGSPEQLKLEKEILRISWTVDLRGLSQMAVAKTIEWLDGWTRGYGKKFLHGRLGLAAGGSLWRRPHG